MIQFILISSGIFILSIVGGYSKYKSYGYKQLKNDEIDSWINDNTMKRTSYNILKRRSTRNTLSSKE